MEADPEATQGLSTPLVGARSPPSPPRDARPFCSCGCCLCWFAGLVFISLIVTIGLVWYYQEKLLFMPRPPTVDMSLKMFNSYPSDLFMPFENLTLTTEDDVKINSWLIKQPMGRDKTAPTIIFFQGNALNMSSRIPLLHDMYINLGVNIMAVSYRGYGLSEGTPTEEGVYRDAASALQYLLFTKSVDHSKIFVLGRSLGGAVAINLAHNHPQEIRGVIVDNTFTSMKDMVDVIMPFLRPFVPLLLRMKFESLKLMPSMKPPVLFISSQKDELVPPQQMEQLYQACGSKKRILLLKNGHHNTSPEQPGYFEGINSFIDDDVLPTAKGLTDQGVLDENS